MIERIVLKQPLTVDEPLVSELKQEPMYKNFTSMFARSRAC